METRDEDDITRRGHCDLSMMRHLTIFVVLEITANVNLRNLMRGGFDSMFA